MGLKIKFNAVLLTEHVTEAKTNSWAMGAQKCSPIRLVKRLFFCVVG